NGDVVVAGASPPNNGLAAIAIFRVDNSGSLDESFGKGGVVSWTLPEAPPNGTGMVFAAAFDHAARILVGGGVPIPGPAGQPLRDATFIARYLPDGTPDPSFGDGGMVVDKDGPPATDIAALSDGSVVSSAEAYANNTGTVSLTRYGRDGKLASS